ncbi:MAG: AAA family ATPase [Planctomycetota bacterium]|nr:MAG: AAA family ATPase [Planctomycetota bacterium]
MRTADPADSPEELTELDDLPKRFSVLKERLGSVVLGQQAVIEHLIIATLCHGHVLLIGVPGLAKTMLIRSLAASLDLTFSRIQFTPDLMPGDILGSEILQTDPATGERALRFVPGPIFANVVLADELNRTPPKTQSALLEAMQERQVTVGGATRPLRAPFLVMATQNPIEQEGAYALPEAQLDRFLFTLAMEYPSEADERRIAAEADAIAERQRELSPIMTGADLLRLRGLIARMPVSQPTVARAVRLVRATRPTDPACPPNLRPLIEWGAGPRAAQALLLAARCLASLTGDPTPTARHIDRLAPAVLRGRIVLSHAGLAQGVSPDEIVRQLFDAIKTG